MSENWKEALRQLPHGTEFRFLDEITALDPGKSGTAVYRPRGTEEFFAGHFPGNPMMPGVLLVEALAQLAGTVAQCDPLHAPLADLRLTAIKGAKITGTAKPGDVCLIHARVLGRMGPLIQAQGEVLVGAQTILRAEVVLSGSIETSRSGPHL